MSASRPISVCMLSDDFLPAATGVGTHVQRISDDLVRRGHRVSVITTRRPGEPPEQDWQGVRVYRTFTMKVFGFYQALPSHVTIRRILRENAVTLVHYHYLSFLLKRAEKVARHLALPRVYTYHMTADHLTQPWPMRPFRPWIARQIVDYCKQFDMIIAPSSELAGSIKASGIGTPTRTISNPVVFESTRDVLPAERPAGFVVLYAGRLNPEKNLPLLLRAFRELLRAVPDSALWIAGIGDQRARLEAMCQSLDITGNVRFLGFVMHSELARYYAACDVFVLPSLVETQGLVAMEAMHFGRPVIVSRAMVSARELVEEGVNGYIVDPIDPRELAARLETMSRDPALRRRLGQAGSRRSLDYAPDRVLDALEAAYAEVIERTRRAA